MSRTVVSSVVLAVALALASSGCATSGGEESGAQGTQAQVVGREIPRSTRDEHAVLDTVWAIRRVASADGRDVRVYEMAGDAAINGTEVRVVVDGTSFVIPANIRSVAAVSSPGPGMVLVRGVEESLDADGMPTSHPWEALLTYRVEGRAVSELAEVTIGEGTTMVQAVAGTAAAFLATVTKVTVANGGGMVARVFETGVGDPAVNGANLVLALDGNHATSLFELGLDVRAVSAVAVDARTKTVRITGTKESLDASGNVVSRPFESRLGYGVDAEGVPSRVFFAR